MNAGLPGTGIGGFFYLITAFFMPINEIVMTIRGESSLKRWIFVARQSAIAGGIILGIWSMGDVLGIVKHNVINSQPIILSTLSLILVVFLVEILNVIQKNKNRVS